MYSLELRNSTFTVIIDVIQMLYAIECNLNHKLNSVS